MKLKPMNPFVAVGETGGATFEPLLGPWTQAGNDNHLRFGNPFASRRFAIYIPTIQKSGEPVDAFTVERLKKLARELGLNCLTQAAGIWKLSTTGEFQSETIWIASGDQMVDLKKIPELAAAVKHAANQDAVAWEEHGELKFTDFIVGTIRRRLKIAPKKNADRLWIVPVADLETVTLRELLIRNGEHVLVTSQPWGARWNNLEDEVQGAVEKYRAKNSSISIRGIKLGGESSPEWNPMTIDPYSGEGLCPLETVANSIGVELNEYERLVVLNLKHRMAGLVAAGIPKGIVDAIRLFDRCAQGSNPDDEAEAVRKWGIREVVGDLTIVRLHRSKCATVTDRFYGQYRNVFIPGEDGETHFYGDAETCIALGKEFSRLKGWSRVMKDGSESFWGAYTTSEDQRKVEAFLRERFA